MSKNKENKNSGSNKTAYLTLRVEPELKKLLKAAADSEHRSVNNMIGKLIRDYCERHGIEG